MGRSLVTQDAAHKVPLYIPVVHIVYIDLHVLPMNNSTTTRRTENAFEKRRLPASACLFSLEPYACVALSRTVVRTTLLQPNQTPITYGTNTGVELTVVTIPSISECLAIANLSLSYVPLVCVCIFFPLILDIKFVGRTSRGQTGGRSHRISHPPSFCGTCLNFSREKDSTIPFPRRP